MEHTPPDNLADWKNMQRRSARDLSDRRAVPCIAHADLVCCIRLDVREQIEKSSVRKGIFFLQIVGFFGVQSQDLAGKKPAGAEGYLLKTTTGDDLIIALRRVAAGQSLVDPSLTASIFERLLDARAEGEPEGRLTAQEQRVLDLIAEGLTNREIAEQMHLAERTIKNYVSNMLGKLGMRHRTEAALFVSRRRKAG